MKYAELERLIKAKTNCFDTHTGTNHEKWKNPDTGETFKMSRHKQQDVKPGTLQSILKSAGLK